MATMETPTTIDINYSTELEHGLQSMFASVLQKSIQILSEKFEFDYDDAMSSIGALQFQKHTEKTASSLYSQRVRSDISHDSFVTHPSKPFKKDTSNYTSPSVVLPYCGVIIEDWCYGIRVNKGLYSQCTKKPTKGNFCNTCDKQCASNNGKPTYGVITERDTDEWREMMARKKKNILTYGAVIEKADIDKDIAILEAERYGMTIPESEFEIVKKKAKSKGRPKKSDSSSVKTATSSGSGSVSDTEDKPKRSRGRPKKSKSIEISKDEEETKNLTTRSDSDTDTEEVKPKAKPKAKSKRKAKTTTPIDSDSEQELEPSSIAEETADSDIEAGEIEEAKADAEEAEPEEVAVKKIKYKGKSYLKDDNNNIYDKNGEYLGEWEPDTKKIIFI